jgi:prepilin-type N-terminal cleavage/methylation domain-containing protein
MKNRNNRGFTVIEIVAVLIIFSVLSAIVMERLGSMDLFKLKSAGDAVESNLRYIQMRSMTSDEIFGIHFSSEGYAPFSYDTETTTETARKFPGTGTVSFSGTGITLSISNPVTGNYESNGDVSFDGYGKPFTDIDAATAQTTTRYIVLSTEAESVTVSITAETGFIP